MVNPRVTEIQNIGENQVEVWLKNNGYTNVSRETIQAGEWGLSAKGNVENVLIQVKAFLHPHRPFKMSDFEVDRLVRRASKQQLIAYAAYIVLDDKNNPVGEISWERLT